MARCGTPDCSFVMPYRDERPYRSRCSTDGRVSLLTVNYNYGRLDDTRRLLRSFRTFVSEDCPVVVVENRSWTDRKYLNRTTSDAVVLGGFADLHHGLGLDWGLRKVNTEYVLICDPDSIIASPSFWPRVRQLVDEYDIGSIDNGATQYHPVCLAFRSETWKRQPLSMEQQWEQGWDVGGALTAHFGEVNEDAYFDGATSRDLPWSRAEWGSTVLRRFTRASSRASAERPGQWLEKASMSSHGPCEGCLPTMKGGGSG